MRLAFSIDALSSSGRRAWRLLDDRKHWRPCRFAEPLAAGDARLALDEAADWHERWLRRDRKHGLVPIGRLGPLSLFVRGAFAHALVHRFSPAPIPDKKQMRTVLAGLAPGTPWLLYLDLGGVFRALDTSRERIQGNLRIAVRGEIASAAGFVGPEVGRDADYLDTLYRQFLAGWLAHLKTKRVLCFVPEPEQTPPAEALLAAIRAWQPEAEPR